MAVSLVEHVEHASSGIAPREHTTTPAATVELRSLVDFPLYGLHNTGPRAGMRVVHSLKVYARQATMHAPCNTVVHMCVCVCLGDDRHGLRRRRR